MTDSNLMRLCGNIVSGIALSLAVSCSGGEVAGYRLVVLDPGHFHASLLQKSDVPGIDDTVYVYAPPGDEVEQYLSAIGSYNTREENPTSWVTVPYIGDDYLRRMIADRKGDMVVISGNNMKKTKYIHEAVKAGYDVLADKPMAISREDFGLLVSAYALARSNGTVIYELMTERHDVINMVERYLLSRHDVFGELCHGTPDEPAVTMESVHYFYKNVSGKPSMRPGWYYDVRQQGEGIADVTTHLVDQIQWQCFPEDAIDYEKDVCVTGASHWPTPVSLEEYKMSTGLAAFPDYLDGCIRDGILEVMANGTIDFRMKGVNARITVRWDFASEGGGDISVSVKKGTLSSIETVQDAGTGFTRQLYVRKTSDIDDSDFEKRLERALKKYAFVSVVPVDDGVYLIDIPEENRTGHEEHFAEVAADFLHYAGKGKVPEQEVKNTLSKYYITTEGVAMAGNTTVE